MFPETPAQLLDMIYPMFKLGLEVFLVIYILVALGAIKQISLMDRTIHSATNKYIYLLGYLNLAVAVFVLLVTLVVL